MIKHTFLVMSQEGYSDPTGILEHPDGELGGEGYIELDQKSVLLGTYVASTENEAIDLCAADYGVAPDVLEAYQLASNLSPLVQAVKNEIQYVVEDRNPDGYSAEQVAVITENLDAIADSITDAFEDFSSEVETLLDQELKYNYSEEEESE